MSQASILFYIILLNQNDVRHTKKQKNKTKGWENEDKQDVIEDVNSLGIIAMC